MPLNGLLAREGGDPARLLVLGFGPVFVLDESDGVVQCDVEVVVEVTGVRGVPRESPASGGLVPLDLVERRAGDEDQR